MIQAFIDAILEIRIRRAWRRVSAAESINERRVLAGAAASLQSRRSKRQIAKMERRMGLI